VFEESDSDGVGATKDGGVQQALELSVPQPQPHHRAWRGMLDGRIRRSALLHASLAHG